MSNYQAGACNIGPSEIKRRRQGALVGAILFHAFNGIRVMLIDFWRKGAKYQNQMFWVVLVLWVVLMAGFVPRQLIHIFGA